jgi:hypothetical protein
MARGQAFETMMLVISVIVALAILAVLLNVVNIADIIFRPTSNPNEVMNKGLKDVVTRGTYVSQALSVVFEPSQILRSTVRGTIPDIRNEEINFACEGAECDDYFEQGELPAKLVVKKKITMNIVVCGDSTGEATSDGNPKYCIGIARMAKDASAKCISECGLE